MFIIAISGGTCSGKTTLSQSLVEALDNCQVIPLDNYYKKSDLSLEERARINHDLPQELDWPLLEKQIFQLKEGQAIQMPVYSFRLHARTIETILVEPPQVLILEGIHSFFSQQLAPMLDLKVFLETTLEQRLSRRLARDLKERCSDIEYVKNKFHRQTERIYQDQVKLYRDQADLITADLNQAKKQILAIIAQLNFE